MKDLIIKPDELLDPNDYPEEQRQLVEDFNQHIRQCMGIITGLGKEYHTIWVVDFDNLEMHLYRTTGEGTTRTVIELGLKYNNYSRFVEEYVERYVVDRSESVLKDVDVKVVYERVKDGELYSVDYMRMSDDGEITYHQMAFALAGEPGETNKFILAYRDIDKSIRKHISDKRYLREQLDIVEALSRDYYNIFKIDLDTSEVVILKLDGYVTKGMEGAGEKKYSYPVLAKQYVTDRVYVEDQKEMYKALSIETIREKMDERDEYVASYRVMDKGEIHYYQFTYIPINPRNKASGILAGFKNVDDVVQSANERKNLEILATTDIMTGILNRGSGESKISDVIKAHIGGMMCVMDIDNFKHINDEFGHSIGDKVIREVADVLKNTFRDRDIVFRLGGDEYAVYAFGIDNEELGETVIKRVFDEIDVFDIPELNGHKVSISVGAVIVDPAKNLNFEDAYRQADAGVYESKKVDGSAVSFYKG